MQVSIVSQPPAGISGGTEKRHWTPARISARY
jgi:hypothetical protein